jgi:hypothetical protein
MALVLGHWSLGARAQRLSDCHQQCQADSSKGAATVARQWLALAVVVVVRWSMFRLPYTSCELME